MQTSKHVFPDFSVTHGLESPISTPEPGLVRRVGAYNDRLLLVEHRMDRNWVGAAHSHPHDQVVYVVSGRLKVTCAGIPFEVRAGDSLVVRGGVEHQASALEESIVIDVFTPCRHEFL
jgi:quercetin dioxygenase-like cupin family protein